MSSTSRQTRRSDEGETLRDLFVQFDMDWFITSFPSDPDVLLDRFQAATRRYNTKVVSSGQAQHLLPLAVASLKEKAEAQPNHAETFLQVFASSSSPEMLAMTWTLLHDAEVASIELSLEQRQSFELEIELIVRPNIGPISFHSDSVFDMSVLRHLGILEANNSPVISGIFPLNLTWDG